MENRIIKRSDFNCMSITKILINSEGGAISPFRCNAGFDKKIKWVFIRDDGWSLGASDEHKAVAEEMWKDEWEVCVEIVEDAS